MVYIQRRDQWQLETVDEFQTRKEARAALIEYRISDPAGFDGAGIDRFDAAGCQQVHHERSPDVVLRQRTKGQ